jgi:hypothetical protein
MIQYPGWENEVEKPGIHAPDPDGNHTPEFRLKDEQEALADKVEAFSGEFDELCIARHDMGEKKYGPGKFLNVDTMDEALMEIVDLANYARYTYVKVRLLQDRIQAEEAMNRES